jgi:3-polyprenyl-4-hydroxybenzoate decarboxylase
MTGGRQYLKYSALPAAQGRAAKTSSSKLGIDATAPLKGYPAMSRPRPEMAERVRQRWAELTASQKTKLRRGGRG